MKHTQQAELMRRRLARLGELHRTPLGTGGPDPGAVAEERAAEPRALTTARPGGDDVPSRAARSSPPGDPPGGTGPSRRGDDEPSPLAGLPVIVAECDAVGDPAPGDGAPGDAGARIGPRTRRALAVAAAAVVAAALLGAWLAWPSAEPVDAGDPVPVLAVSAAPASVVVSVAGDVREPGLVELPAGSRVADAVTAAGGPTHPEALGLLNLARRLVDGELIVVGGADPAGGVRADAPINLNAATSGELEELPGVGPVLARRIVEYRTAHGAFGSVEELRQVDGIGAATFADLRDRVAV